MTRKNRSNIINFAFKEATGINIGMAAEILLKKGGIKLDDIEKSATRLFEGIGKEVEGVEVEMDDHYLVLYHLMITYFVFKAGVGAFNDWIKEMAAEHNMKDDKYRKIMYKV